MQFDIVSLLTAIGITHGFFLAFLLLKIKRVNRTANIILSVFLINLSVIIFYAIIIPTGLDQRYPFLGFDSDPFQLLAGPLFYFYIKYLTMPATGFKRKNILHLLPALFAAAYLWLPVFKGYNFIFFENDFWLVQVQIWIYLLLSMSLLKRYKIHIKEIFSSIDRINLSWLNYIIIIVAIFLIICLILMIIGAILPENKILNSINFNSIDTDRFTPLLVTVLIWAIGYKGLTQPEIFSGIKNATEGKTVSEKSLIPKEKLEYIINLLSSYMEKEKPFLNSELTLPILAEMLDVPRNILSTAINRHRKQNFYDYINSYRVETVKEHLMDIKKQNMNILNMAYDAGFNSKATFNYVFKKLTNQTPTEYKKNIQKR
jgi:AraC-like DNA-binding protein